MGTMSDGMDFIDPIVSYLIPYPGSNNPIEKINNLPSSLIYQPFDHFNPSSTPPQLHVSPSSPSNPSSIPPQTNIQSQTPPPPPIQINSFVRSGTTSHPINPTPIPQTLNTRSDTSINPSSDPNLRSVVFTHHNDPQTVFTTPNTAGSTSTNGIQHQVSTDGGDGGVNKRNFVDALMGNPSIIQMNLPTPVIKGNLPAIKLAPHVEERGLKYCQFALVGRLDLNMIKTDKVREIAKQLWKPSGECKIIPLGRGYLMVRFELQADYDKVCGAQSWPFEGQSLRLQKWSPCFDPETVRNSQAIIWVKFPKLKQQFWDKEALFSMANAIGKPVSLDKHTRDRNFGYFASVMVEADMSKQLPDKMVVELSNGVEFIQEIQYAGLPKFCNFCKIVGHTSDECRKIQALKVGVVCSHCHLSGHKVEECRKLKDKEGVSKNQKRNRRRGNSNKEVDQFDEDEVPVAEPISNRSQYNNGPNTVDNAASSAAAISTSVPAAEAEVQRTESLVEKGAIQGGNRGKEVLHFDENSNPTAAIVSTPRGGDDSLGYSVGAGCLGSDDEHARTGAEEANGAVSALAVTFPARPTSFVGPSFTSFGVANHPSGSQNAEFLSSASAAPIISSVDAPSASVLVLSGSGTVSGTNTQSPTTAAQISATPISEGSGKNKGSGVAGFKEAHSTPAATAIPENALNATTAADLVCFAEAPTASAPFVSVSTPMPAYAAAEAGVTDPGLHLYGSLTSPTTTVVHDGATPFCQPPVVRGWLGSIGVDPASRPLSVPTSAETTKRPIAASANAGYGGEKLDGVGTFISGVAEGSYFPAGYSGEKFHGVDTSASGVAAGSYFLPGNGGEKLGSPDAEDADVRGKGYEGDAIINSVADKDLAVSAFGSNLFIDNGVGSCHYMGGEMSGATTPLGALFEANRDTLDDEMGKSGGPKVNEIINLRNSNDSVVLSNQGYLLVDKRDGGDSQAPVPGDGRGVVDRATVDGQGVVGRANGIIREQEILPTIHGTTSSINFGLSSEDNCRMSTHIDPGFRVSDVRFVYGVRQSTATDSMSVDFRNVNQLATPLQAIQSSTVSSAAADSSAGSGRRWKVKSKLFRDKNKKASSIRLDKELREISLSNRWEDLAEMEDSDDYFDYSDDQVEPIVETIKKPTTSNVITRQQARQQHL